jgi:hypothetical protein
MEGRGGVDDHGEELRHDGAVEPRANDGVVAISLWIGVGGEILLQ